MQWRRGGQEGQERGRRRRREIQGGSKKEEGREKEIDEGNRGK